MYLYFYEYVLIESFHFSKMLKLLAIDLPSLWCLSMKYDMLALKSKLFEFQ